MLPAYQKVTLPPMCDTSDVAGTLLGKLFELAVREPHCHSQMSLMHEFAYVINGKHLRVRTGLSVSKSQTNLNISENEPNGAALFLLYSKKETTLKK